MGSRLEFITECAPPRAPMHPSPRQFSLRITHAPTAQASARRGGGVIAVVT